MLTAKSAARTSLGAAGEVDDVGEDAQVDQIRDDLNLRIRQLPGLQVAGGKALDERLGVLLANIPAWRWEETCSKRVLNV